MTDQVLLEKMTWPEIKEAMENGKRTVLIFAASTEQHGPHLAENTDLILGYAEAEDLAHRLGDALVAPVIRPGLSKHHLCMPGSLTLRPETFRGVVEDYVAAYVHHGFENIVLTSSHGGNFTTLDQLTAKLAEKYPDVKIISGCSIDTLTKNLEYVEDLEGLQRGTCGGHACDWETSVMLYVAPEFVHMECAQCGFVGTVAGEVQERFFNEGVKAVSSIGVMGDPTTASAERGKRYFEQFQALQEKCIREKLGR